MVKLLRKTQTHGLTFPTRFIYNLPLSAFIKHQSIPRCWIHRSCSGLLATLTLLFCSRSLRAACARLDRSISINVTRHHERRKKPNSGNIQNHQPADELGRNMQSKPSQIEGAEIENNNCCFTVPLLDTEIDRRYLADRSAVSCRSLHLLAGLHRHPIARTFAPASIFDWLSDTRSYPLILARALNSHRTQCQVSIKHIL